MVMTDKELLEQLFEPARQMTVADNGFSDRVMERIPRRSTRRLSRLWTIFCVAVAGALFVVFDGCNVVAQGLVMMLKTRPTQHGLLMLTLAVGVVWLLAFIEVTTRVAHRERLRLV
jgi:hypothetical protein